MATLYEKKEGLLKYTPSVQDRLELSKNYHVQHYLLKLTVNHDNAADSKFNDEEVWGLINHLELVANGNNTIKSIPAKKLFINSLLGTTQKGLHSIDRTAGNGKTSTVFALIPLSLLNTVRPHDTILDTGVFKTLDLLVNWGSDASIGTGITVNSAVLDVYSSALTGYSRNQGETIKYFVENNTTDEVLTTTTNKQISLAPGHIYKTLTIVAAVDGIKNDKMIKGIKIKSGNTIFVDLDADALRAKNIFEFRPEQNNMLTGIWTIDFAIRGRLSDCLDTRKMNTIEVVLDVEKQAGTRNDINILADIIHDTNIAAK